MDQQSHMESNNYLLNMQPQRLPDDSHLSLASSISSKNVAAADHGHINHGLKNSEYINLKAQTEAEYDE